MEKLLQSIFKALGELFSDPTRPAAKGPQPYIKNSRNQKLINYWWSQIFYDNANLQRLAGGDRLHPRPGRGLIYYYVVKGQVRYIGQTRERSLKWRMTRRQPGGNLGYNYSIKRQMLNAFRSGSLQIKTREVGLADLNATEEQEIRAHSRSNRLWNIEHNSHYKKSNRWS